MMTKKLYGQDAEILPYAITAIGAGTGIAIFVGIIYVMSGRVKNSDGTSGGFPIWYAAIPVGTIRFFSGRTKTDEETMTKLYDSWEAITDPYEVFKHVKKTSVDIKTDFNYPNALRPEINPGYNTKYDPKS